MFFEPSSSVQISVYLKLTITNYQKRFEDTKNESLLIINSTNDKNFIAVDYCTMIVPSRLQVIQLTPPCVVVACYCSDCFTFSITSNNKCSLTCCYCCIPIKAEIYFEFDKNIPSICRTMKNILIMIRIFSDFGPSVACNIKYFSLIRIWVVSTNSQWSFANLCQCCGYVSILCICLIVK